ncbi:MAG: aminomethyl-transferring glycine dehydrogenase subunit GcvPB, partial [Endomicrobiales bacterium]|nr:aminomethyl-transferring glycine dehydrogenase subunit GcvPB [Endomicrobiales bacterium]
PVGVKKFLEPFLPLPVVELKDSKYTLNCDRPKSIGKVRSFYGNFPVLLKACAYIMALGADGLKKTGEQAVMNANYLLSLLIGELPAPAGARCMHEFVLSGKKLAENGVRTLDLAKRLLDYGYYAPTVYFPLIVEEAIMIEPTETESKETLDEFAQILLKIVDESMRNPELVRNAPQNTPVSRLNEVEAARKPVLRW